MAAKRASTRKGPTMTEALVEAIKANQAGGESLNALARRVGLEDSALSRFVRGERSLTLTSADRVAEALGLRLVQVEKPEKPASKRKRKGKE